METNKYKKYYAETVGACKKCNPKGFLSVKGGFVSCDCLRWYNKYKQLHDSGLPRSYWNDGQIANFAGDVNAKKQVNDYMAFLKDNISKGIGLYLYGNPGVGKTLLASNIVLHSLRYNIKAKFYYFTDVLNMFTDSWKNEEARAEIETEIINSDILILDDVGKEYHSNKKLHESILDTVLRTRASDLKPIILTSNYDILDIKETYGAGIVDLFKEHLITVKVDGESYRKQKMDEKKK